MDVISWLLEPENPAVRYRTLIELLDHHESQDSLEVLKREIAESKPVRKLLDTMHPDGYWLQKNPRTGQWIGHDVEYGSFGTTHFCLNYCAELGLDRSNPRVAKAAERYLDLQKDDGDWYEHLSCLYAYNIRTFLLLGYRQDKRVQRAIDLMLGARRPDGGYLCDMHEKAGGKPPKSCIRGSVKALMAFAELPEYWHHERCRHLVDYFLNRNGIYRSQDKTTPANSDMQSLSFPITWRADTWQVLLALSKMGYGRDERLAQAWDLMDRKRDTEGRYRLDWTPALCPWKIGKRGEPNKWVTLYCLLGKKYSDMLNMPI